MSLDFDGAIPFFGCRAIDPIFVYLQIVTFMSRKRAEIPIYSFAKHARETATTSIYSPHVLILEGILALYDPRVLELLDMRVILVLPTGNQGLC